MPTSNETIKKILNGEATPKEAVGFMKNQKSNIAKPWTEIISEWDPARHPINVPDEVLRKVSDYQDHKKTSIAFPEQQMYTNRMCDMTFGLPVKREYSETDDPKAQEISEVIEAVLKANDYNSMNRDRFVPYFGGCQMATVWMSVPRKDGLGKDKKFKYGSKVSNNKIICKVFSPMQGHELNPLFDEYDDLIAFGIGFSKKVNGMDVNYYSIYTAKGINHYILESGKDWAQIGKTQGTGIGKISLSYIERPLPIFEGTSQITYDKERKMTNNGRYIEHNSVPNKVMSVQGDNAAQTIEDLKIALGVAKKDKDGNLEPVPERERPSRGLSRDFIGEGLSMQIVEWQGATDATKFHVETMGQIQDRILQLPDLSPEAISNISTETLRMALNGTALRVTRESGKITQFLRREINVVKEHIKPMFIESEYDTIDDLIVESIITPYQISDDLLDAQVTALENGGNPTKSWEQTVKERNGQKKGREIWDQLQEEAKTTVLNVLPPGDSEPQL